MRAAAGTHVLTTDAVVSSGARTDDTASTYRAVTSQHYNYDSCDDADGAGGPTGGYPDESLA